MFEKIKSILVSELNIDPSLITPEAEMISSRRAFVNSSEPLGMSILPSPPDGGLLIRHHYNRSVTPCQYSAFRC